MTYKIKEVFYTLQGEGRNTGRAAVFCRFAYCNLWTGREKDRHRAICQFCDTDFADTNGLNGGKYTAGNLAELVASMGQFVVCTGGEPLLQMNESLVQAFHSVALEIAVETNGTKLPPPGLDWICVSPKANAPLVLTSGNELKLVYPQADPAIYEDLDFRWFYLQPMDGPDLAENTRKAVEYCLAHPRWRLSLQTHKYLGIP